MNTGIPMADTSSLMQVFTRYRRPFSSCKPNEEWAHKALPCYNESEKTFLYEMNNCG